MSHLEAIQQLLGKLENICQMLPFTKAFRYPLLQFIKKCLAKPTVPQAPCEQLKRDQRIWMGILKSVTNGLPIAKPENYPPLNHLTFVTGQRGRKGKNTSFRTGRTVLGISDQGCWFGFQIFWPNSFAWVASQKSSAFSILMLLLPLAILGKKLTHRHVVITTKKQNVFWA